MAKRYALLVLGWVFVILGILGMILPLLPTTVFILCAGWCFSRSSERFHHWLFNHPKFGPLLRAWHSGEGISRFIRNRATVTLWLCLLISMLIVANIWVTTALLTVGIGVSIYLWRLPILDEQALSADMIEKLND